MASVRSCVARRWDRKPPWPLREGAWLQGCGTVGAGGPEPGGAKKGQVCRSQGHAAPQAFPSISCLGPKTWQDGVGTLNHQPLFSWGARGLFGLNGPFFFWPFPPPPRKTSDVKGIGNQEQAPGQGRAAPRSLAGRCRSPPRHRFLAFCSLRILGPLPALASRISQEANITHSSSS